MDDRVFDGLTKSLVAATHRRVALRNVLGGVTLAATGLLVTAPASEGKKKRNKPCPECPVCPSPPTCPPSPPSPPAAFCAGKNTCTAATDVFCQLPGAATECECYVRQDNGESICGEVQRLGTTCGVCAIGEICVVLGDRCRADNFACVTRCPAPL